MLKGLFTSFSFLFLLGAGLLLFLTNLNGGANSSVLRRFYWLQVDTSGISGISESPIRWTLYNICQVDGNKNTNCGKTKAAFPFSPADNFKDASSQLPQDFVNNRDTYFYLSRCAYAFLLVALAFTIFSIIIFIITPFIKVYVITPLFNFIALLFDVAGAACLTAAYVKGRREFNDAGHTAKINALSFGLLWASVACLILSFIGTIFYCVSHRRYPTTTTYDPATYDKENFSDSSYQHAGVDENTYVNDENPTVPEDSEPQPDTSAGNFRFFRVNRKKPEVEV
ncbi:endocytosis/sphingolipid biosynthesis/sporulation effector [Scheffersomyces coipomensis]|uniref:endocytosis/sphingolipid biosynthesis/sporulation effector n=1 Tax=Scheffersomyces coipomensis TaxID=1788519 RepID=UPI00315D23D0